MDNSTLFTLTNLIISEKIFLTVNVTQLHLATLKEL